MKRNSPKYSSAKTGDEQRTQLEVNLGIVLAVALGVTILIYALIFPFRSAFIGVLLYERGFTQPLVIWFTSIVMTLTVLKIIKIRQEFSYLRNTWIPEQVNFKNPQSQDVLMVQKSLSRANSLLGVRCSRVLSAYIESGNRKTATEFALDDSSFYLSNSESSYALPRILIWAIPLLGFIGTVIGISRAVNGFSGFLEKAGEVEQIKEGIGTVTSGLAVAFDTTLLALLMSIVVMIPLVLVERYENRLLLGVDIFINDQLLPRLAEKSSEINEEQITETIEQSINQYFPNPESLIAPAHEYAQQAVTSLTNIFTQELSQVRQINQEFLEKLQLLNQFSLQDREQFVNIFERQQRVNGEIIDKINIIIEKIQNTYQRMTDSIQERSGLINEQLQQTATILEKCIQSLEETTNKLAQINELKETIDRMIYSLEKVAKVEPVVLEVVEKMQQLKPSLDRLSKPRIITFVESDGE